MNRHGSGRFLGSACALVRTVPAMARSSRALPNLGRALVLPRLIPGVTKGLPWVELGEVEPRLNRSTRDKKIRLKWEKNFEKSRKLANSNELS
ncbi:hypothetical protein Syun_021263 [Stephania yunnanensis]|uniref:Uncharacterized protein n=1 Tax=Stephania yunnanensis TaxID=152371 RepID=A0AAP0IGR6_9MAGN